jgi:two-component system sensor kinase FixL
VTDPVDTASYLHEIEARYRGLLDATVDAIIMIDSRGEIEVFSTAAERIFGYRADEVVGSNVRILMPEPDAGAHDRYIANYLASRRPQVIGIGREVVGRRRDGSTFPMELAVGEIGVGADTRFVGIARDVSARKEIERALREREEELHLIVNNAPIGIFVADRTGSITAANPALGELMGCDPASLIGREVMALAASADREQVSGALEAALSLPRSVHLANVRWRGRRGEELDIGLHLQRAYHAGRVDSVIGQVVDHTEEQRASERMRRAQEDLTHAARLTTLGEMASAIAHEINQPLTAIATQAQAYRRLIQGERASSDEVATAFEDIAEQALRIGQVVKGIRAFVTKRETDRGLVEVNELLGQVLDLAWVDAGRQGVAIELDLNSELPRVFVDSVQIQQVCLNLLRNGIDAMVGGDVARRILHMTSRRAGEFVEIVVDDCGPGVPPAVRENLFHPFFTTKKGGMGMGLSISHSIVVAHGGTLHYEDNPEGGARFVVSLPRAE